jgi:hypothetical protein
MLCGGEKVIGVPHWRSHWKVKASIQFSRPSLFSLPSLSLSLSLLFERVPLRPVPLYAKILVSKVFDELYTFSLPLVTYEVLDTEQS